MGGGRERKERDGVPRGDCLYHPLVRCEGVLLVKKWQQAIIKGFDHI